MCKIYDDCTWILTWILTTLPMMTVLYVAICCISVPSSSIWLDEGMLRNAQEPKHLARPRRWATLQHCDLMEMSASTILYIMGLNILYNTIHPGSENSEHPPFAHNLHHSPSITVRHHHPYETWPFKFKATICQTVSHLRPVRSGDFPQLPTRHKAAKCRKELPEQKVIGILGSQLNLPSKVWKSLECGHFSH